jgi:hypothetical protein
MTPIFASFQLIDECGEGEFQECVIAESGGPDSAPLLHVRFERPAEIGSRFDYRGLVWELTEEKFAKRGAIAGGETFWAARPVEQ